MEFIELYYKEILTVLSTLLPMLSVMIPKVLTDRKLKNTLSEINLNEVAKTKLNLETMTHVANLARSAKDLVSQSEALSTIMTKVSDIVNTVSANLPDLDSVLVEVKETKSFINDVLIQVQAISHQVLNVSEITKEFAKQSKEVQELKDLVKKLVSKLGV